MNCLALFMIAQIPQYGSTQAGIKGLYLAPAQFPWDHAGIYGETQVMAGKGFALTVNL